MKPFLLAELLKGWALILFGGLILILIAVVVESGRPGVARPDAARPDAARPEPESGPARVTEQVPESTNSPSTVVADEKNPGNEDEPTPPIRPAEDDVPEQPPANSHGESEPEREPPETVDHTVTEPEPESVSEDKPEALDHNPPTPQTRSKILDGAPPEDLESLVDADGTLTMETESGLSVMAPFPGRIVKIYEDRFGRHKGRSLYLVDDRQKFCLFIGGLEEYAPDLTVGRVVASGEALGRTGSSTVFSVRQITDPARWWEGEPLPPLTLFEETR